METTKKNILQFILTLLLTTPSSNAQFTPTSTSDKGRWKLLKSSIGISAMHVALLPNDKVIIFDRTDFGPSNISLPSGHCRIDTNDRALTNDCTAHSVEFTYSTRAVRPLTVLTDTWCSSGSLLSNGTLIQTGGFNDGDHAIRYFSPCDECDWIENSNGLVVRRWYATNNILPDGRVIVIGGRAQFSYEFVPSTDKQVFELPFLRETKDKSENNLYPFVHLSPDGNLFIFANTKSILLDYKSNKVVRRYAEMPGGIARCYPSSGSSVLLPLQLNNNNSGIRAEVMICGGTKPTAHSLATNGTFIEASNTCGRLTITDETPEWEIETMPIGRVMGDMVLLPTGDVLIVNGANKGTAGWGLARDPVLNPVLYRPCIVDALNCRQGYKILSPSTIPRLYHSTAHLLSDGRVLVGGSNPNSKYEFSNVLYRTELSLEGFSPPYLTTLTETNSSRPQVVSIAPSNSVRYGEKMAISVELGSMDRAEELAVTMVAPAFTTHSFSMNQRLLVMKIEQVKRVKGNLYVVESVAPATGTVAPAGYYMLFVVQSGVPSRGEWVKMLEESVNFCCK